MKASKYCGSCQYNVQGEINKKQGVVYYKCELNLRYFKDNFNIAEHCKQWKINENYK